MDEFTSPLDGGQAPAQTGVNWPIVGVLEGAPEPQNVNLTQSVDLSGGAASIGAALIIIVAIWYLIQDN
jgi:hypothetical protein